VTSTWGDGDPPDNAIAFWNFLNAESAPRLEHLQYSVLALGDSSYADFCGAGKKFDTRLEQLGAKRIQPRVDCDKDYEPAAKGWVDSIWSALRASGAGGTPSSPSSNGHAVLAPALAEPKAPAKPGFHREHPFPARLATNRPLTTGAKETRHFEISLEGSEVHYEVGDALGVAATNCPDLVARIIARLGCDGEEEVRPAGGASTSLRSALHRDCEIHRLTSSLIQAAAERSADQRLKTLVEPGGQTRLTEYCHGRDVLDLLQDFPTAKFSAADLIANLRRLSPRLYSIASALKAHPKQVHLTVAIVRWESHGRPRKGLCSTFLAERSNDETPVPVFIQPSPHFRLPANSDLPVIMVGPGTGIAPFRAFLEERIATGARGRNWLFFGHQHEATDFFYRDELTAARERGALTRLDTAFSRDQPEKIYVQHRMIEQARELWSWLQDGAHFYVCGDASRMAKDVDAALHQVAREAGGLSTEKAAEYVQELKTQKRYQRDVY